MKDKYSVRTLISYITLFIPFCGIIPVIFNHFIKKKASDKILSHLLFQSHTFWLIFLCVPIFFFSVAFKMNAEGVAGKVINLLIPVLVYIVFNIWMYARMIKGVSLLSRNKSILNNKNKYFVSTLLFYIMFMLFGGAVFPLMIPIIFNFFIKNKVSDQVRSHLLFQSRTFWLCFLFTIIILLPLLLFARALEGSPGEFMQGAVCIIFHTWICVRMIKGIRLLLGNQPIPN